MKILLLFLFFVLVVHSRKEICQPNTFYFKIKKQCEPSDSTVEKDIFSKLNISQTDTHETALKHWLEIYESLKGKKFTILHIDSRKFHFYSPIKDPDIDLPNKLIKRVLLTENWETIKSKFKISISNFMGPMVYCNFY
jgi:hypothetical protein